MKMNQRTYKILTDKGSFAAHKLITHGYGTAKSHTEIANIIRNSYNEYEINRLIEACLEWLDGGAIGGESNIADALKKLNVIEE